MGHEDEEKSEEEEKEMKKEEKREKGVEIQEKGEQLMINLNEAKLMHEENWIETTKLFPLFSCVSAFHSSFIVSPSFPIRQSFILFCKFVLIFVIFVEEEFEETDEEICKIRKKIARSEMQETIEEERKAETQEKRRKKRERVKRMLRKKVKTILSVVIRKMWEDKTRTKWGHAL